MGEIRVNFTIPKPVKKDKTISESKAGNRIGLVTDQIFGNRKFYRINFFHIQSRQPKSFNLLKHL